MNEIREWIITRGGEGGFDADLREHGIDGVWRDAWVKFDGCVQYRRFYNTPKGWDGRDSDDTDNIHLCSIAQTVGELIDLLRLAHRTLGGEWNGELADIDRVLSERGYLAPKAPQKEETP